MATTGLDSVLNEIANIKSDVARSYEAVKELGGTLPGVQALAALPSAIRSLEVSPIGRVAGSAIIHLTLNASATAYLPTQALANKLLAGAKVYVYTPNAIYSQTLPGLGIGDNMNINVIPSPQIPRVRLKIVLGAVDAGDEICAFDDLYIDVAAGQTVEAAMNLKHYEGDGGNFLEVGRVQRLDQSTSSSYLIVRKYVNGVFSEERFGWYKNETVNDKTFPTNWVNDTGIYTFIPELDSSGEITNENPHPTNLYWERDIFPYCDARRVRVHSSVPISGSNTASADFYFSEVPIYYIKNEIRSLLFATKNAEGEVLSSENADCRIWWLSKVPLPGYELPSWEKKWIYTETEQSTEEVKVYTKSSVAKLANYYACYKNVTKSYQSGNVIQSYPYEAVNSGNSRGDMCNLSKVLNNYSMTIYGSQVFEDGTELAADETGRRFQGNTWQEFQAFRYLMYIQFGTDIQATLLGLTKNNNSGDTTVHRQSALETARSGSIDEDDWPSGIPTFSLGKANESHPIQWLFIVNPHGSEGDQMADATVFAERIEAGTQTTMLVTLDRSLLTPHATVKSTMLNHGYEQLSYKWTAVGKSGTHKRGLDANPDFWAFQFPAHNDETAAIELGSSSQVDTQWLSGHPAAGTLGEVARMCSLSHTGSYGRELGPWCVYASSEPSHTYGSTWGARVSMVLSADEANGAVGS